MTEKNMTEKNMTEKYETEPAQETEKPGIKIKICGIRREQEIEWMNELQPEYVGFMFAKKSRRFLDPDRAAVFREMLDSHIQAVGVFVNEEPQLVAQLLNAGVIDIAQLHGQEGHGYVALLRMLTDHPLICAVQADSPEGIRRANESPADLCLLDHGKGGTGESFDWTLLSGMRRPFLLAGGLCPENVRTAIASAGRFLYGVDVSSGVETDGVKDYGKIKKFIRLVRET